MRASFPTTIKDKFYEGEYHSKCDIQTLTCKVYQVKEWVKLGRKLQEKIYDWRKELEYKPYTGN